MATTNTGSAVTWNTAGTGGTGKQYEVSTNNNTIKVSRPDGTTSVVTPGDANYNATWSAMQADLKGSTGSGYTPYTETTKEDGTSYKVNSYTPGNADLNYALQQAVKQNGGQSVSVNDYANSLLNSGKEWSKIEAEMSRLGLQDYLPGNGIYTTSGVVLPKSDYGYYTTGDNGVQDSFSDGSGQWYTYGGQSYRVGGNGSQFADYVNAKTGNSNNAYAMFNNMSNNQFAQQDPEFLSSYNAWVNNAKQNGYLPTTNTTQTTQGNYGTGASIASQLNTGTYQSTGSDLLSQIAQLLQQSLNNQNSYLDMQRDYANSKADEQTRQAWVDSQIAAKNARSRLAMGGLGTSGAVESAMMGAQDDYNQQLGTIRENLTSLLQNLDAQGLQALTDYYNNLTNYTYNISNDEMNRALQNLQYQLQLQEFAYQQEQDALDRAYQTQTTQSALAQNDWDNAYKLLTAGIVTQDVANALGMTLSEAQDYAKKLTASKSSGGSNVYSDDLDAYSYPNPATTFGITTPVNYESPAFWQNTANSLGLQNYSGADGLIRQQAGLPASNLSNMSNGKVLENIYNLNMQKLLNGSN